MARRRADLAIPASAEPRRPRLPFNDETFGRIAETVARNLGTARYLLIQTAVVIAWIIFNVVAIKALKFDPYPFILLNLAFSTQASYAAPLILLAQNRQEDRDRAQLQRDRDEARRTQQDTEYLARELAAIRIALADVATESDLESVVERVVERLVDADGRRKGGGKKKRREAAAAEADAEHAGLPAAPTSQSPDAEDEVPSSPS